MCVLNIQGSDYLWVVPVLLILISRGSNPITLTGSCFIGVSHPCKPHRLPKILLSAQLCCSHLILCIFYCISWDKYILQWWSNIWGYVKVLGSSHECAKGELRPLSPLWTLRALPTLSRLQAGGVLGNSMKERLLRYSAVISLRISLHTTGSMQIPLYC